MTNPEAAATAAWACDTAMGEALAEALVWAWILTALTGELGADALAIFKLPFNFEAAEAGMASTDSLLFRP